MLVNAGTVRLPDAGSAKPIPAMSTRAAASEALQEIVTDSPAQAAKRDEVTVSDGRVQL